MALRLTEEQFAALTGNKKLTSRGKSGARNMITTGYRSNVQGKRTIGGKEHTFKSLWEIQFAHTLEFSKERELYIPEVGVVKDWKYEPRTFRFPKEEYNTEPFAYIPDFQVDLVGGKSAWFEIKGYMNGLSAKKDKRFRKHYPEEELVVIGKSWFSSMRRRGMNKLMKWEEMPT